MGDVVVAQHHAVTVHQEDADGVAGKVVILHQVVAGIHEMQRIAAVRGAVAADGIVRSYNFV